MANVKKIKLPSNTTYNINDYRIPNLTASDAGKILKVNSTGDAFEITEEAVVVYKGTLNSSGAISFTQTYQNLVDDYTAGKYVLLWAQGSFYGTEAIYYLPVEGISKSSSSVIVNFTPMIISDSGSIVAVTLEAQGSLSDTIGLNVLENYITLVTSVNGQTDAVTLTAANVGAIAAPSSATNGQVLTYNGTTWVASTPAAGGTQKIIKTITGDGSTVNFTFSTSDVVALAPGIVQVYDSTGKMIVTDITFTTTSLIVGFDEAPTTGTTYTVVIIG